MSPSLGTCVPLRTRKNASLPDYEYYLGSKDQQNRRNGIGLNHWTSAESMEWYTGRFIRDAMHGPGEYFCRYRARRGLAATYEGNFYVNRMHGYGVMSYSDGKVFTGLFSNNVRYGPGLESFPNRRSNVGLWRGPRLIRLPWRPSAPSVAPELHVGSTGRPFVEPHRVILNTTYKTIGKINSAIELLKECGSEPVAATENWTRLYPKSCTDTASQLCQVDLFDNYYYKGRIYSLQRDSDHKHNEDLDQDNQDSFEDIGPYYAWNNNEMAVDMMKHCFKHERQRNQTCIELESVLTGPRKHFLLAGIHELDCRTLLMAAYLGHVASTTYLINERGVDTNITDMQGNSALIYATCGDQKEIMYFLIEAGANVDSYNDSCCTALSIALMRLLCAQRDISIGAVAQAMIPPPSSPPTSIDEPKAFEFNIIRDLPPPNVTLAKSPSRVTKLGPEKSTVAKKEKSLTSLKDTNKKKTDTLKPIDESGYESDESLTEENKLYKDINCEFVIRVTDLPLGNIPPLYLFDVYDMVKDLDFEEKVVPEKNPKKQISKVLKETTKTSKEVMWQNFEGDEDASLSSTEKSKIESLERIKSTIQQLLEKGANPNLVKCPHPALFMAITSGSSDLVRQLLKCGADVNEIYPHAYNYTILDIAVSRSMTYENLEIIRALLEGGARADYRLRFVLPPTPNNPELELEIPGPTLLHAVLARKVDNESEEEIRKQLLELLLEYNCDPMAQFKGRSAFDIATKNMDILDIIIRSPKTNLNAIINDQRQTILVKIFHLPYFKTIDSNDRFQTLTNLLLFGADPLRECQNGETLYKNLFVMTKNTLLDLESIPGGGKSSPTPAGKKEPPKKDEKAKPLVGSSKSTGRMATDDLGNYKQAIDLITECARILHIRWLQGELTKELVQVIDIYKHRHWNTIVKEHKRKKATGLWLPAQRCLEIWDLLKTTKKKIYNNKRTLKHLLCIVYFYNLRSRTSYRLEPVTSEEKNVIERDVNCMIREHKKTTSFEPEMLPLQRLYVQPELFVHLDSEFDVCFECASPLEEERIQCQMCNLVSFCNLDCIKVNIDRTSCHPCSDYFKEKYFPSPPSSLKTVAAQCKELDISFHLLEGNGGDVLPQWVIDHKIGAVVCDFNPLRTPMGWLEGAKKGLKKDVPLIQVDAHNVVPCWVASDKQEYSARTIRNKINSKLGEFLTEFPPVIKHPHKSKFKPEPIDWEEAIESREADKSVGPVEWATPGYDAAVVTLKSFLEKRLKLFATKRNDPTLDALSNLSPWFHFGQISVQRVALCVQGYKSKYTESVNAFLEEAIVRSELADNFCFYNPLYDSVKGTSNWAQKTLDDHRKDKRTHIYTCDELAQAKTHDDLWNSAQLQLVKEGKMHGFLRMYWCKKILEWTPSPEDALKYAIYLNDHYSIDGRDSNGYVGCMWSICGIHDQGWAERAVFGKVRFMNYDGCKRKFNVSGFVARYGGKVHKYIPKK